MKNRFLLLILPLLTSCSITLGPGKGNQVSSSDSSCLASEWEETPASSGASGQRGEGDGSSSSRSGVSGTLEIYAINDFHGQVNAEGNFPGIKALGTYFKDKGKEENTLLISSGDMFQGSIESNYNSGHLLADVMNDCRFDALSLGNHEFDWGLEAIKENKKRVSSSGYQTPYLCANLYDYDGESEGSVQQSEYGGEYVIREESNGIRVGIIGAIGKAQITSIESSRVASVCFKDPVSIVKGLSDELRTEKGCDVVILSYHASQSALLNTGVTSVSSVSGKRYVDLVLCAHTHKFESTTENGVLFTQNDDKGENASHVTLTLGEDGEVTSSLQTISSSDMASYASSSGYDESISSLVATYGEESEAAASETLGTLSGSFYSSEQLPNLVSEAILEEANKTYAVDLAMTNSARTTLKSGTLTYGGLFAALPFDNEIYVMKVTGDCLFKNASSNYFARAKEEAFSSSSSVTYTVAVIDYLATHQNSARAYDKFPGAEILGTLSDEAGKSRIYRDIASDYIKAQKTVRATDYSSSADRHSYSLLSSAVSL